MRFYVDTSVYLAVPPSEDGHESLVAAPAFHRDARLTRFVTRDEAQRQAARELGLPV